MLLHRRNEFTWRLSKLKEQADKARLRCQKTKPESKNKKKYTPFQGPWNELILTKFIEDTSKGAECRLCTPREMIGLGCSKNIEDEKDEDEQQLTMDHKKCLAKTVNMFGDRDVGKVRAERCFQMGYSILMGASQSHHSYLTIAQKLP